jgi:hypothetical protein
MISELTFGGTTAPVFAKADVVAGAITATASWTVVGTGVDPVAAPKTILSVQTADQFGLTVAGADAVVDVEDNRETYVGAATTDVITLTHTDTGGGAVLTAAATTSSVITITGDFTWADDPLTAAFDVGTRGAPAQIPVAVTGTGGYVIGDGTNGAPAPTSTTLSLVASQPANGQTAVVTFTPLVDNIQGTAADLTDDIVAVALPDTAFTASQVVTFNDEVAAPNTGSGTQNVAAASAGAWTLNGASVKVFSVPFGSEVESHSIFVSNKGATTGAISGSVAWNGNAPVSIDLGNVQANANKYLNVMAALEGIGAKPAFGRADITFTVNSPAADITFTAGYTTAAGRANLFMEEQANLSGISNAAKTSAALAATEAAAAHVDADAAHTDAAAAATQGACTYAALGEGIDVADAAATTAITEQKYTKTGGC